MFNLKAAMEIAADDAEETEFAFGIVWKIALTHWVKAFQQGRGSKPLFFPRLPR